MNQPNHPIQLLLTTLPLLTTTPTTQTQPTQPPPQITVTGTAHTNATPNLIHWHIQIRTQHQTPHQTATQHQKNLTNALTTLRQQNINHKKTQTTQTQLTENIQYQAGQPHKKGYQAQTHITFQTPHLNTYQTIWTNLTQLTGITIHNTTLHHTHHTQIQNQTLTQALKNAQHKAQQLAQTLNHTLGKPLHIHETTNQPQPRPRTQTLTTQTQQPTLAPGTIPIHAHIQATFQIHPQPNNQQNNQQKTTTTNTTPDKK